jgi:mono/diheme cytochrome c family protein
VTLRLAATAALVAAVGYTVRLDVAAGPAVAPPAARPRPAAPDSISPFAAAKARLLIRDRLPCLGCHRLDGEGGRIGPDLTGVGKRREASYVLAMLRDPQGTVPGTAMPRTPMTEETLLLVAGYLLGLDPAELRSVSATPGRSRGRAAGPAGSGGGPPNTTMTPAPAPTGTTPLPTGANPPGAPAAGAEQRYAHYCASCHGVRGEGDGFNARDLPVPPAKHASAAAMSRRPDDALYDAIAAGGYVMNRSNRMPAFGETLAPAEIRALVRHIRRLCGCEGPAWSRDGGASGHASGGAGGRGS